MVVNEQPEAQQYSTVYEFRLKVPFDSWFKRNLNECGFPGRHPIDTFHSVLETTDMGYEMPAISTLTDP